MFVLYHVFFFFFFFFKQKTAYEITYGDWSSDVCSSDLRNRTVSLPDPFAPCHSRKTGVGPGCAAHSAAMARAVSGSGRVFAVQRSATPIAPLGFRSSRLRAESTMNGACSSPRSRGM